MQSTTTIAGAFLLVSALGCNDSSDANEPVASDTDVATYQELVANLQSASADYRAAMMEPEMTTVAACQTVHEAYDLQVRPWVAQMGQMSGTMDAFMGRHGGGAAADHQCVSATMMNVLDTHHSRACGSPDLSADRAEATRYLDEMMPYAAHDANLCAQMRGALDGGVVNWGPMMEGCLGWDEGCGMMMHDRCCRGDMHGNCVDGG